MPTGPPSPPGLVRPPFGPSLPDWLRARTGIPPRVTLLVAVALVVLLAGVLAGRSGGTPPGTTQAIHRGEPTFNLLYAPARVRRRTPAAGELERMTARGPGVRLTVTVRRLAVPGFDAARGFAGLPIAADRLATSLRARLDGFAVRDEGRARVNTAPGYQLRYRFEEDGRRATGIDVFVAPDQEAFGEALILSFRQVATGPALTGRDLAAIAAARSAFRSLRYGTERG